MKTSDYGLELKFCRGDAAVTLVDGSVIEGYASLFGLTDQGGDVVQPGAYKASLARIAAQGGSVKMLWQHDPAQPIGIWEEIREDARGLYVKGRLLTEVAQAREAAALIQAGAIDGLSIGYRTVSAAKDGKGRRLLEEVDLWEVSLVTFPMLREARVAAKGDALGDDFLRELAGAFDAAAAEIASPACGAGRKSEEMPPDHEATKMTEITPGAGRMDGEGQAASVKTALTGFLNELKGFQGEVKSKLQQQDERLTMLQTKNFAGRPALSTAVAEEAPHQKAFEAYVRSGAEDALRGLVLEGKGMTTSVNADGGYLVDRATAESISNVLRATSSIRQIATVVNVEATSYDVLIDRADIGSGWATEAAALTETTSPIIERITIPLYELAAMPKASQRLLDDAAFDVEGWLASRIAEKFSRSEAAAFVNGDGVDKPKGFLNHTSVANASWAWGSLGYIATGVAGDFNSAKPADAIVDLVYALNAEYRANATFVMNSKTAGAVRKMKDADGRFLWTDSLAAGEPARLMGYPVLIAEDMPDIAANANAIAFGDFGAGYTIAERPDLRILRDPFSAKPHVLFYASKRVGGNVSDFAAIKLLKFAAS